MQTHDLALGHGEEAEGIGVAQVGLDHEGQLGQIVQTFDAVGPEAPLVHPGPEQLNIVVSVPHDAREADQLKFTQIILSQVILRADVVVGCQNVHFSRRRFVFYKKTPSG